ncbi:hypothetical protein GGI12_000122 [Dipsacomyces acuminosporus]|nr:hypothetical protein GGI12_000122 [Dipsacomyces acuminosporus]
MIQNNGAAATIIQYLIDNISSDGMPNTKYAQYCDPSGDPAKTVGIIIDSTNNKNAVKDAVQGWSMGKPWTIKHDSRIWSNKDLWFFDWADRKNGNANTDSNLNDS